MYFFVNYNIVLCIIVLSLSEDNRVSESFVHKQFNLAFKLAEWNELAKWLIFITYGNTSWWEFLSIH